jgi:hypothetical protein
VYGKGFYSSLTTDATLWVTTKTAVFYIRRLCNDCTSSHQEIIYKRLTDVPEGTDLAYLFLDTWYDSSYTGGVGGGVKIPNNLNTDFKLFDNLDDAINDNDAWNYCNYNDPHIGCKWR